LVPPFLPVAGLPKRIHIPFGWSSNLLTGTRGKNKTVSCQAHNLDIWRMRAPLPLPLMRKIQGWLSNPYRLKAFHGWSTVFWVPFTILAFSVGWLQSVTFVSLVSMIALFLGSFSSWQASRTEVIQAEVMTTHSDHLRKLHKLKPKHKASKILKRQAMKERHVTRTK
jgi:hypothetical protein